MLTGPIVPFLQVVASSASSSPFAALSLIVAPGILTNACSVLAMSTSNRLARAVDLARELTRELEASSAVTPPPDTARRLRDIGAADARGLLLVRALRAVYASMAGFATATLVSLIGVVLARGGTPRWLIVAEVAALVAGLVGTGGVVWAAALLVRETRIAVASMRQRILTQQERFRALAPATPPGAGT